MKDLIENICIFCVIICVVGLIFSLAINNIVIFLFSVLFMFAFWAIAIIDLSNK